MRPPMPISAKPTHDGVSNSSSISQAKRLEHLGVSWADATQVELYVARPLGDSWEKVVLPRVGGSGQKGIRWHYACRRSRARKSRSMCAASSRKRSCGPHRNETTGA
jgi:hypothetical protein